MFIASLRSAAVGVCAAGLLLSSLVSVTSLARKHNSQTKVARPVPTPDSNSATPDESQQKTTQDIDTLKTDTDLVTVPVIVSELNGSYVADLRKEDFGVTEDGVKQEVAFFQTVTAPFHVVLLLDTSASTEKKLKQIQQAAFAFVDQLQKGDKVKVISFDDRVRELNEFTDDRAAVKKAIAYTESGQGTKVYDAIEVALNSVRKIPGRKAFVIFTDGVDWHSDRATFDTTIRWLDEEGVIVYPIRYETRAETETLAREQSQDISPALPTLAGIRTPPAGTTAPTFPSDDPDSVPVSGRQPKSGPLGLPLPGEIMRGRRQRDPDDPNNDRRAPTDTTLPPIANTLPPPRTVRNDRRGPVDDSISATLDLAYSTADKYLNLLAEKSGGTLLRADSLASLPGAFSRIAVELRTQYLLGYYPINKQRDERYRRIRVTTLRKNVAVRARPGYLSTGAR